METPEKANMRTAQEYKTMVKQIHQRIDSIHLLAEMFNCSTEDVEIMLALLRTHGVYEITDAVEDITVDTSLEWSFGTIVLAAKQVTLNQLHDRIDDDLHDRLSTVVVSTQPSIYGAHIGGGEGLNMKTLEVFSDMIKYGVRIERITELKTAYAAAGVV